MTDPQSRIDYARFGQLFFENAVTEPRIRHAFERLQTAAIEFGPISGGPGGLARISGKGYLQAPAIEQTGRSPIRFNVLLSIDMTLAVRLTGIIYNFVAGLQIPLIITAEAHAPLLLRLHVAPPLPADIELRLTPRGRSGGWLSRMANMQNEIRRQAARYVEDEIDSPEIRALCDIDIADRLEKSWYAD